jgi:hypothetical protein
MPSGRGGSIHAGICHLAAFTGVSITFAPYYLYKYGQDGGETWEVAACFAVIYLIPGFYIKLGSDVIRAIRNKSDKSS